MEFNDSVWISMQLHGSCMDFYGLTCDSAQISIEFHGFSMDFHTFWMDFNGRPYIKTNQGEHQRIVKRRPLEVKLSKTWGVLVKNRSLARSQGGSAEGLRRARAVKIQQNSRSVAQNEKMLCHVVSDPES
jgi:hypothetical protein